MEKQNLVTFDKLELEVLTSESELSEVRGGKGSIGAVIDAIIEFVSGGDSNTNCGCTNNSCS